MHFTSTFICVLFASFASFASADAVTPQVDVPYGVERLNGTMFITGAGIDSTAVGFYPSYTVVSAAEDAGVSSLRASNDPALTSRVYQQPAVFQAWDQMGETHKDSTKFWGQITHAGACLTRVVVINVTFISLSKCAATTEPATLADQTFYFTQSPADKSQYTVDVVSPSAPYVNRGRNTLRAVRLSDQDGQQKLIFNV